MNAKTPRRQERFSSWRLGVLAFMSWVLLAVCSGGCTRTLAERLVQAPNLHSKLRGVDAPPERLDEMLVSRQLRISVGPPPATISVWVIEPTRARESIELVPVGRRIEARLKRRPS